MDDKAARFRGDLEKLIGAPPARLGLAVSGGPDSLALLLLAAAAYPGRVEAATVDHGLRVGSAAEAAFVAGLCRALGVPHAILSAGMTETSNLQAAARVRRYALLGQWAEDVGASALLTAHHADDQAETLVMRLLRGSGLSGLSGIRAVNPPLVRPLLGWRRAELAEIVRAAGIDPVADPSNADERFDRVRIRGRLAEAAWLDPAPLARSAAALAEAEEALDWIAERLMAERTASDGAALCLDPAGLPPELLRRLVLLCLRRIAPDAAPRGEQLTALVAALGGGETATLSGILCRGGKRFRFEPAPTRRHP
jgi:tRNA(Ile)-lysidine synthase